MLERLRLCFNLKLFFLDPTSRASINIHRLKNYSFNLHEIIAINAECIDNLVILGDGSPEDEIIGIIAWHQSKDSIIGITKPKRHYTDSYRELKGYLKLKSPKNFVFVTDQDDLTLTDLFNKIKEIILEQGITVESIVQTDFDRLKIFECSLAAQNFNVISVVSGLSNFATDKHEIEDHLLSVAGIAKCDDSKDRWNMLSHTEKEKIFRSLKQSKIATETFPQFFEAFSFL